MTVSEIIPHYVEWFIYGMLFGMLFGVIVFGVRAVIRSFKIVSGS